MEYPVLHFDLSTAKNRDLEGVRSELDSQLCPYEAQWEIKAEVGNLPGQRLSVLIKKGGNKDLEHFAFSDHDPVLLKFKFK